MNMQQGIDYRNTSFELPDLFKIHGEPKTGSLLVLKNEVKANAMIMPTILGGGTCSHLRLVLAPVQYNSIVGTVAYVRPPNTGPLHLIVGLNQYQITQAQDHHQEALYLFQEVTPVKLALKQQILGAIGAKYLKVVKSSITQQINRSVPDIFTYLFNTYGDVTPQALQTLHDNLKAMHFDPVKPVEMIFTEVDDLADIADLAKDSITKCQKISIEYIILQCAHKFSSGLGRWNDKPDI
eukprot:493904-Ditylum_brightwellii.AAC.1